MHINIQTSANVKPLDDGPSPPTTCSYIPLNIFDMVVNSTHVCLIYAFRPPNPPNSTLKVGLQRVLCEYREWAGRLGQNDKGEDVILLNDKGVRFIEAVVETSLDEAMLDPRQGLLSRFHPCLNGVAELIQVQLTRFSCGSLVVGFTASHYVADGNSGSAFLVAWGMASRGLDIGVLPTHDRNIAVPRNPPRIEFQHRGLEFVPRDTIQKLEEDSNDSRRDLEDVVVHKVHFTGDFLKELRAKASESTSRPCSNFKSLAAHLWRVVTKARRLQRHQTTQLKSSVDGRRSMGLPNEYFGNLVLWAFPTAEVSHLLDEPLSHAAGLIQEAISTVQNKDYFLSFIDFAATRAEQEDLICTTKVSKSILYPNMEIHTWEHFPFGKLDFGAGTPFTFMPSTVPIEGLVHLLPSFTGDDSIDAFVHLFRDNVAVFNDNCYVL